MGVFSKLALSPRPLIAFSPIIGHGIRPCLVGLVVDVETCLDGDGNMGGLPTLHQSPSGTRAHVTVLIEGVRKRQQNTAWGGGQFGWPGVKNAVVETSKSMDFSSSKVVPGVEENKGLD